MTAIVPIDEADLVPGGPTAAQFSAGKVLNLPALAYLRVRIKAGDVATVRPWYYRDGEWWPVRGDGASPSPGAAPVTANPATFGGKAEGYFAVLGLSGPVMLVSSDGSATEITKAFIEPCEALP